MKTQGVIFTLFIINGLFSLAMHCQTPCREQYYHFNDSSAIYLWVRDSIVIQSGYYYSYDNFVIRRTECNNKMNNSEGLRFFMDTIDECHGRPILIVDSICQRYEVISIRRNPMKKCDQWQKKGFRNNFYMIDVADTLHHCAATIVSMKKREDKTPNAERIKIGNTYDMVLFCVEYEPIVTWSSWAEAPCLGLCFNRHKCKAYTLVTSPNINGPFYIPSGSASKYLLSP